MTGTTSEDEPDGGPDGEAEVVITMRDMAKRFPNHVLDKGDGTVECDMTLLSQDFIILAKMAGNRGPEFFSALMELWVKTPITSLGRRN